MRRGEDGGRGVAIAINVLLYQAGWLACILGAARGYPQIGVLAAAVIVAWHLARAPRARPELALIGVSVAAGAVFETALVQAGWVRYSDGLLVAGAAPYWMIALWATFATTLNVSLRALRPHLAIGALLGAVAAPAAYYAGARLGALDLVDPRAALVAIGVGWGVLAPALLDAARRLDGYAPA